jgi:hypothetical protein
MINRCHSIFRTDLKYAIYLGRTKQVRFYIIHII